MSKVLVSKTVFSRMKKDVENKRKKVDKEVRELKQMEASMKQLAVIKLGKR